jgi:hypothetical protein
MFSPLQAPSLHSQEMNFTRPSNRMHTFWGLIFYNIVDATYGLLYINNSQDLFLLLCHNTNIMSNGYDVGAWNMHQGFFSYGTMTLLKEEHVEVCWIRIVHGNLTYSNSFINTENILVTKEVLLGIIIS